MVKTSKNMTGRKEIQMESYERLCPVEYAGGLDSRARKWLQNPTKILNGRVREGMVVLELGCGPGFFTTEIARMVGRSGKVIAADLQEGMLDIVRNKIKGADIESRIELHKCEEDRIGITEKVDLALAFFMVHEVADRRKMLAELKSILKPDGRIYIIEFRMHPPKRSFDGMVKIASQVGLVETERKAFFSSRAVVFEIDKNEMKKENDASRRFTGSRFYRLLAPTMAAIMESPLRRRLNDASRTMDGAGIRPGTEVLEVGCGTGYFTLPAARQVSETGHLHSIDLSPESVDLVRRKVAAAGIQNVSLELADAMATGLPGATYDTVLLLGVIPAPVLPLSKLLPEMHRLLKPGGRLAVWPAVPLVMRPAFAKSGLFAFEGKVDGVFRFKKIETHQGE
jgi:ubiquinone/menaquinone biosynthesis C-methylase UbiE